MIQEKGCSTLILDLWVFIIFGVIGIGYWIRNFSIFFYWAVGFIFHYVSDSRKVFWCLGYSGKCRESSPLKEGQMGHDHQQQQPHHHHERDSPLDDPFLACCCCPCYMISYMFRGIGRCMFVCCYPILQCFGLDEWRHQHQQRRFHWFPFCGFLLNWSFHFLHLVWEGCRNSFNDSVPSCNFFCSKLKWFFFLHV